MKLHSNILASNSDEQVIKLTIPFAAMSYITKTKDKMLVDILQPCLEEFVTTQNAIRIGCRGKEVSCFSKIKPLHTISSC